MHFFYLFFLQQQLWHGVPRRAVDAVPFFPAQLDFGSLNAFLQPAGVHRTHDWLHFGRVPQQPGQGDAGAAHAVLPGKLVKAVIQLQKIRIIDEDTLKHAVLKGRPGLDGDIVQPAVVQHAAVAIQRRVFVDVDMDAIGNHAGMRDAELKLVGMQGLAHKLLQQRDLHGFMV